MFVYKVLDVFFLVFHTLLILFILSGWIWKRTRKANLVVILLTAASWGILGIFYGFGYWISARSWWTCLPFLD